MLSEFLFDEWRNLLLALWRQGSLESSRDIVMCMQRLKTMSESEVMRQTISPVDIKLPSATISSCFPPSCNMLTLANHAVTSALTTTHSLTQIFPVLLPTDGIENASINSAIKRSHRKVH